MPDIADDRTTTASMTLGGTFTGQIDTSGDRDWVRISLSAGQRVQVNLDGTTLSDPYLRIYDTKGALIIENDDANARADSEAVFMASTAGDYFISVGAFFDNSFGGYTITAQTTTQSVPAVTTPFVPGGPLRSIVGDLAVGNHTIAVYFGRAGDTFDGVTSEGFNAYERGRFQVAFDQIEAVADIHFVVVTNPDAADFRLVLDTNEMDANTLGYFYSPGSGNLSGVGVFNGNHFDRNPGGNLERGGDGAATITHELMHGLGLMHPHDTGGGSDIMRGVTAEFDDYGVGNLNQGIFTAMSYNPGHQTGDMPIARNYGSEAGPMALDIAALQLIYGAVDNRPGNTAYRLPGANGVGTGWQAIWDTGGTDTMIYDGSRDATLNLRPATLAYAFGGGGFVSSVDGIRGGFTIARGVVIDNAIGGGGNDRIVGNGAANVLNGRGGNDVVYGQDGNDILRGGNLRDTLIGGRGADVLQGQQGDDSLKGELGADRLIGGAGRDAFVFTSYTDSKPNLAQRDTIVDFTRGQDRIDLSVIDGHHGRAGNQAFVFQGVAGFDGADGQGDVRIHVRGDGVMVAVDVDGDGDGDLMLLVLGVGRLDAGDFVL